MSTIVFLAVSTFLVSNVVLVNADLQIQRTASNLNFIGNDVDSKGVLWAGDKNFTLWKSTDNGASFQYVYNLPHEAPLSWNPNPYSGLVWTVFIDSRDYIFVSGGGAKSALYRSTDGGVTFNSVVNANDTTNRSFYVSMTEDNQTNIYVATYTIAVGLTQPWLLKSTNGGSSWSRIGGFSVIHFHSIEYNPYNGYLYAITGERSGSLYSCNDSEKIFRSKDLGSTWSLVVDRNDSLGTVYLPMTFAGNYVYVGQDYPSRNCQIHRFYDDGKGPFAPQIVYSPPNDGYMPFVSAVNFNNMLIFANCVELQNGTSRIIASGDGVNWGILDSASVNTTNTRWNFFTTHPRSGAVFGTLQANTNYQIRDIQPTPPPTPVPTMAATPQPTPNPTIQPIDNTVNTVTVTPTPKPPTPTPLPNHNSSTSQSSAITAEPIPPKDNLARANLSFLNPLVGGTCIVAVIFGALTVTVYVKKKNKTKNGV